MNLKRILALALSLLMALPLFAGCAEKPADTVLVVGVEATFEEKWNPFLVESAYDHMAVDQVFDPICELNARGELTPRAGSIEAVKNDDGTVTYTIKLNKGMKFSDGKPVTIDDYIYALYVRADPSYAGKPGSLLGEPIEGVENYFYDDPNYESEIKKIEDEAAGKYGPENITLEDFIVYAKGTNLDGWWTGDPAGDAGGVTWSEYIESEGFGDKLAAIDATNADAMLTLLAEIEWTNYRDAYDTLTWFTEKNKSEYATGNLEDGVDVPEISGVVKVDDLTCTVKYTRVSIVADRGLTTNNGQGNLVPKHYYGEFEKGDVSKIISNMEPMGSGPYIWGGFADNIITCTANVNYWQGVPKTGTVRWQYVPPADVITSLASGVVDIINVTGNKDNLAELDKQGVEYDLLDNAGYGYLGFNTERVPLDVRRGVASLMNRGPSVSGYYGPDIAKVIERPLTTNVAEYPLDAKEFYPYSREKATQFFTAAGYSLQNGKLVDSTGKQLVLNVYIGGSGEGDHPAYAMLIQAREDLEALGGELQVQDVQFGVLQGAMNDGTADMWVMAWGDVFDCDKSSQFHSTGGQNRYKINDPKMDNLLDTISATVDLTERRALVSEMLDYAMDQMVEYPLYQRKNIIGYNKNNLVMESLPESTATFDYENVLWQLEVLPAQ